MSEQLPGVPSDGVFAVDALQDYRDTWHTYGYNDCLMLECIFLAEEGEISLASAGPSDEQFKVNLTNASDAVDGAGRKQGDGWGPSSSGSCSPSSLRSTPSGQGRV